MKKYIKDHYAFEFVFVDWISGKIFEKRLENKVNAFVSIIEEIIRLIKVN